MKAKDHGGMAVKLMPTLAGIPDRMLLFPNGLFIFVETKAPQGRLRPGQQVFHERLRKLGFRIYVTWTMKQVDALFRELLDTELISVIE